jgi:hypothetical protein
MAKEDQETKKDKKWNKNITVNKGGSGVIYGLGLIGAVIYYIQHATTFMIGVIGVIKAVFWPAVLIYYVFDKLKL